MASYDYAEGRTLAPERLSDLVTTWCVRAGFSQNDAGRVADVIVDADLCGAHSHGVRLLVSVRDEIRSGTINPAAQPVVVKESGVVTILDAEQGFGPVACTNAVDRVVEGARRSGIAAVAVRHSSHWGRPAYYGRLAAERGLILIGLSNSAAAMPLWGTAEKNVGNNPIVISVPRSDQDPLVLDISMQVAAWGQVRLHLDSGERLPGFWGYAGDGSPTDDPKVLLDSGRIRPMGDHKGSGLAVMFEMLTAGLSGGIHSVEISELMEGAGPQGKSQLFIGLDARWFSGEAALERVVSSFASLLPTWDPVPGGDVPRLPGQGSAARRRISMEQGVLITRPLALALETLAADLHPVQ